MVTLDTSLDLYYERMSHNLGDKKKVLNYLKGKDILDVGCGSGDLVHVLEAMNYNAFGLDASEQSVLRSHDDNVHQGYADEVHTIFGIEKFDTIICSSVLHEVFSYGNRLGEKGRLKSLSDSLTSFHAALKPGGRLIVRDGVKPADQGTVLMWVDHPHEVDKYLTHSPFSDGTLDRSVAIDSLGGGLFEGSASSVMEFAFTYTWGEGAFNREVQEFYGVFELDDYAQYVQEHGFVCVHKHAYLQPGYVDHLEGKVKMSMPFPHSNAVWVYEKE